MNGHDRLGMLKVLSITCLAIRDGSAATPVTTVERRDIVRRRRSLHEGTWLENRLTPIPRETVDTVAEHSFWSGELQSFEAADADASLTMFDRLMGER